MELTNAPLSISTLSPASGAAGTQVTIRGSGFDPHASVSFNGTTVPARFVDADTLQVAVPASSAGSIQVAVKNPDGQTYVLDNGFITQ